MAITSCRTSKYEYSKYIFDNNTFELVSIDTIVYSNKTLYFNEKVDSLFFFEYDLTTDIYSKIINDSFFTKDNNILMMTL